MCLPMIFCFIAVKFTSVGPAIYWSKRMGKNDQEFLMPKFRSMYIDTPLVATNELLNPEKHLTCIGSFIRKTNIDELPQLCSVFMGKMSIVGPRPALVSQKKLIRLRRKHSINTLKPGISGWAQINGRDFISVEKKVKFDCEYFDKQSMLFDLKIVILTLNVIFSVKNISH